MLHYIVKNLKESLLSARQKFLQDIQKSKKRGNYIKDKIVLEFDSFLYAFEGKT